MDLLSDLLLSLKLRSTIISNWQLSTPWGFETGSFPAGYCMNIVAGEAWFLVPDCEPVKLLPGDSVLVLMGGSYSMASSVDAPIAELNALWGKEEFGGFDYYHPGELQQVNWGGGGDITTLLSLGFEFQPSVQRDLLNALPGYIILRQYGYSVFPSFKPAITHLSQDVTSGQPGFGAIATQLAELVIIGQLRSHILSGKDHPTGWLQGLSDIKIGKALAAIHRHPESQWSVGSLASFSGMSRSGFAKRFQQLVGLGPIEYLNNWRIQLAADLLQTSKLSVMAISERVGYPDDRRFRRIFKQRMSMSPLAFRRDSERE